MQAWANNTAFMNLLYLHRTHELGGYCAFFSGGKMGSEVSIWLFQGWDPDVTVVCALCLGYVLPRQVAGVGQRGGKAEPREP